VRILAIDPGTTQSGWVIVRVENDAIVEIKHKGITPNDEMYNVISELDPFDDQIWCEMIASQGMAVGQETFETCVWIGRLMQWSLMRGTSFRRATRNQIKLHICGTARAKDPNITQALKDRFGVPGTKKEPGFTNGITSHMWQALSVAAYAVDYNAGRVK